MFSFFRHFSWMIYRNVDVIGYCLERVSFVGNSSLQDTAWKDLFLQGTVLSRVLPVFFYFSGREQFSAGYCLEKYFLIGNYSLKNTAIFFFLVVQFLPRKKCFVLRTFPVKDRFWKCHEVLKEQIKFWSACFLDMKRCQAKKISQQPFLHRRSKEAQSCSCRKKMQE